MPIKTSSFRIHCFELYLEIIIKHTLSGYKTGYYFLIFKKTFALSVSLFINEIFSKTIINVPEVLSD